jgi:transposase
VLLETWQKRGLYIFFLPAYSPQLNIAERLWKEIKEDWIKPSDYIDAENLFYAVDRICGSATNAHFHTYPIFLVVQDCNDRKSI